MNKILLLGFFVLFCQLASGQTFSPLPIGARAIAVNTVAHPTSRTYKLTDTGALTNALIAALKQVNDTEGISTLNQRTMSLKAAVEFSVTISCCPWGISFSLSF